MRGASELRAAEGATGHATGQGARPPAGPPLGAGEAGSWRVGLEAARPTLEALASILCTPVWLYYCVDDAPASATAAADAKPNEAFDQALDQALEGPKARHRRPTEVVAPPLASRSAIGAKGEPLRLLVQLAKGERRFELLLPAEHAPESLPHEIS